MPLLGVPKKLREDAESKLPVRLRLWWLFRPSWQPHAFSTFSAGESHRLFGVSLGPDPSGIRCWRLRCSCARGPCPPSSAHPQPWLEAAVPWWPLSRGGLARPNGGPSSRLRDSLWDRLRLLPPLSQVRSRDGRHVVSRRGHLRPAWTLTLLPPVTVVLAWLPAFRS